MKMNSEKLLIIGCGSLGERLAGQFSAQELAIVGVRRKPPVASPLNIDYRAVDIEDHQALATVCSMAPDYVLITLTPATYSPKGYVEAYVDNSQKILMALQASGVSPQRVFYVSSTRVYSQQNAEWVTEASPMVASSPQAQALIDAEQLWLGSDYPVTVLRPSGLYDETSQRLLLNLDATMATTGEQYTNRIHRHDAARAIAHLVRRDQTGQPLDNSYILSDLMPVTDVSLRNYLCVLTGRKPCSGLVHQPLVSGKQLSAKRLSDTGFTWVYPTYKEGYGEVVKQLGLQMR